ncbi:MAG: O-methyltransferase [Lachnospiraceae bacterium]|nr:O-methyltransferase [Lachnospiraceae bacterium]
MIDNSLEEYITAHIDAEPPHLKKLNRDTHVSCLYANMCSGHEQGRLLKMLVRMMKPCNILELGTFTGYSAQCLAEGMPEGGMVHTIEINDEMEEFIRQHLEESPYGDKITLHVGDASQVLPSLDIEWDLVFIDANKRHYLDYYNMVFPMVRQGGFIIADNTLWYGKVTDSNAHDAQTEGILRFNDFIQNDPRVENVFIPVRDGLSIIYKKQA